MQRRRPRRWRGRADRSSRSPATSTRSFAGSASSGRRSRRSWPRGRTAPCRTPGPVRGSSQEGDGVVLDFGGVYDGYCVDLTRTVQLGDAGDGVSPVVRSRGEAQRRRLPRSGRECKASAVDAAARAALGRHGLGDAFGHGTGHGLGLEVHEEPRIGRPLAGQPDLVLAARAWSSRSSRASTSGVGGVRIEDDVLVTDEWMCVRA